jgi:hypothetical protein
MRTAREWERNYWFLAVFYCSFALGQMVVSDIRGLEGHIARIRDSWLEFGSFWSTALYVVVILCTLHSIMKLARA